MFMDTDMEDVSSEDLEETYIIVNPSTYFTELYEYDGRRKELDEKLKFKKKKIFFYNVIQTIYKILLQWPFRQMTGLFLVKMTTIEFLIEKLWHKYEWCDVKIHLELESNSKGYSPNVDTSVLLSTFL